MGKDLLINCSKFYIIDFKNIGGLVMPIILDISSAGNTIEELYIPAEV